VSQSLTYILSEYTRIRVFGKGATPMKRYELSELIKRWERGDITPEQAIGQALLWLVALAERVTRLEASQRKTQPPKPN
jgi:hypothetical protein